MSDVSMLDFHARLHRIAQIRAAGGGFEAEGTLGRSAFAPPRPRPSRWHGGLSFVMIGIMAAGFGIMIKVAALQNLGPMDYTAKIAALQRGNVVERVSASLLQIDPVTEALAKRI